MKWLRRIFSFFSKLPCIIRQFYLDLEFIIMGRVVITIDEIVAGRGLRSNKASVPPALEVFCGKGLKYGDDEDTTVNAGQGLAFGDDDELVVANEDLAGVGLVPGDGSQLDIDTQADPAQEFDFRVVTDTKFVMDGYRLVFCTTYTTFIVHRNQAGVVIGFEEGDKVVEQQPLNIEGYGYGTSPISMTPKPTAGKPSFYKS